MGNSQKGDLRWPMSVEEMLGHASTLRKANKDSEM